MLASRPLLLVLLLLIASSPAFAQAIIASPDGRKQVAVVPTATPVTIDGILDDDVWKLAAPATGFIQADPQEGQPATEATEVRLAYDADYLYIGVLNRDTNPEGIVVNEIRKDFGGRDQDTFEVMLDTFGDRRNGFVFSTNAKGAKADTQVANETGDQ